MLSGVSVGLVVGALALVGCGDAVEAGPAAKDKTSCDTLAEEQAAAEAGLKRATTDEEHDRWLDEMVKIQTRQADCDLQERIANDDLYDELDDTTTEEAAPPAPDPSVDYASACDLNLNSDFDEILSGGPMGWLVADAELHNTGNVGVVVRVTATFKQAGSKPLKLTKTARVPDNKRRNVHFKQAVQQEGADAFQSAPGYFNGNACSVKATVTDTLGKPQ